ncbi:hypothetical protein I7I50_09969 [Histoplasma capsulatum G186AR]|uniref:Uncharacterized protein n=1 Tax=Ajellomyces capsulatus TaxID=5037 RepID=A0A8H7Z3N2_AJECA|nr:hypothetical protein I7I52_01207 [Histoplasma capsulatum]QSS68860.1 hypothetical protein I7I50_09969 [Histoplasma capsulatum G186AR]
MDVAQSFITFFPSWNLQLFIYISLLICYHFPICHIVTIISCIVFNVLNYYSQNIFIIFSKDCERNCGNSNKQTPLLI